MSEPGADDRNHAVYPFQRLITLVETVAPGSANLSTFAKLGEQVDPTTLHAAATALLQRHPALRYRFIRRGGGCWQQRQDVDQVGDRLVVELDVEGLRPSNNLTSVKLPLTRGPLLHLRAGDEDAGIVGLTSSHIVSDRWSLWLLERDFTELYRLLRRGDPLPAPPRRGFGEFVDEDHAALRSGAFDGHFEYWRERLAGARGVPAASTGRHAQRDRNYQAVELSLTASDVHAIRTATQQTGQTEFAVLAELAAGAVARTFDVDDVVLIAMTANRPRRSSWDVVGCFTNAAALRFTFPKARSGSAVSAVATDLANSAPPFEWIVERLAPADQEAFIPNGPQLELYVRSDGSPEPLAQVEPHPVRTIGEAEPANTWGLDLDIMIDVSLQTAKAIKLTYRPDRVPASTCERVLELFGSAVASSAPVSALGGVGDGG